MEYIDQFRGWFYLFHILSVALFNRPALRKIIVHGIALGDNGNKMNRSRRNYPDINGVFDHDGSDTVRWFLVPNPILRGGNLIVTERSIREGMCQTLLSMWNAYSFPQPYASKPVE